MNFAKFLTTPFFTEHLRWLLLQFAFLGSIYDLDNGHSFIIYLQNVALFFVVLMNRQD